MRRKWWLNIELCVHSNWLRWVILISSSIDTITNSIVICNFSRKPDHVNRVLSSFDRHSIATTDICQPPSKRPLLMGRRRRIADVHISQKTSKYTYNLVITQHFWLLTIRPFIELRKRRPLCRTSCTHFFSPAFISFALCFWLILLHS